MTKAERIRELYAKGLSTRQIADRVGCDTAYVRVVARQRVGGDRKAAREACRRAYAEARQSGLSPYEACGRAGSAYNSAMLKTRRAARRAEAQA